MNPPIDRKNKNRARAHVGRRRRIHIILLEHSQHDTPSFSQWLQMCVKDQLFSNVVINENIVQLSQPLARKTYTYEKMWAYGNHYCVDVELGLQHLSYDYVVTCIFRQASHSSTRY